MLQTGPVLSPPPSVRAYISGAVTAHMLTKLLERVDGRHHDVDFFAGRALLTDSAGGKRKKRKKGKKARAQQELA